MAGGVERDVSNLASLADDEDLHGLGHLSAGQHGRIHQLPALNTGYKHCFNTPLSSVVAESEPVVTEIKGSSGSGSGTVSGSSQRR